jgi:uncharacterized RDD family membrane protein YckC
VALLKVQTAQNVEFDYTIGNAGLRIVAALLDLLTVALFIWFMSFVFSTFLQIRFFQDDPGILFFFVIALPAILYLPTSEYFWNGRTVGKFLLKLRVVKFDGSSATLSEFILRWLLRTIDVKLGFLFIFFLPREPSSEMETTIMGLVFVFLVIPFPLVGILFMVFTKHSQRLGDLVANTVVVRKTKPYSLEDTILKTTDEDYKLTFRNVMKLRDKDIYIIKQVLDDLKKTGDYGNSKELSEKAREILNITEPYKPVELLRIIVKDYNHMARRHDAMQKDK